MVKVKATNRLHGGIVPRRALQNLLGRLLPRRRRRAMRRKHLKPPQLRGRNAGGHDDQHPARPPQRGVWIR